MSSAKQCDRCGELYKSSDPCMINGRRALIICGLCNDVIDLCPKCSDSFVKWFDNVEVKVQYMTKGDEKDEHQRTKRKNSKTT